MSQLVQYYPHLGTRNGTGKDLHRGLQIITRQLVSAHAPFIPTGGLLTCSFMVSGAAFSELLGSCQSSASWTCELLLIQAVVQNDLRNGCPYLNLWLWGGFYIRLSETRMDCLSVSELMNIVTRVATIQMLEHVVDESISAATVNHMSAVAAACII